MIRGSVELWRRSRQSRDHCIHLVYQNVATPLKFSVYARLKSNCTYLHWFITEPLCSIPLRYRPAVS